MHSISYKQNIHTSTLRNPSSTICSAMDCIGRLPTLSKGNQYALTIICLLTLYLVTVPLKTKSADEVFIAYMKEILPKLSSPTFILQDNDTEF